MKLRIALAQYCLALTLLLTLSTRAQSATEAGDLWEDTTEMSMPGIAQGMPMRSQIHRRCSPHNSEAPPITANAERCVMSDVKHSADNMSWKMSCPGNPPTTATGEMIYEGRYRYHGTMTMDTRGGVMTMKMSGQRIGECDATEASRELAATRRQATDAQQQVTDLNTMTCKSGVDNMMSQALRPDSPYKCGARYKADFCGRLQTEKGFVLASGRRPVAIAGIGSGDLSEGAAFCSVDPDKVRAHFCKPAEEHEALDLLASSCVGHGYGSAIVARECAGRTFSSPPAERYRLFCSAVARDNLMQPADDHPQKTDPAASAPQTTKKAAVETGKKLLNSLFGH
ncbi:MAG: DUF3617 domain-containing protein [Steroidobacteraceae bacterium]